MKAENSKKYMILENAGLILILMMAIGLSVMAKSRTWSYPEFQIMDTEAEVFGAYVRRILVIGSIAVLEAMAGSFFRKNRTRIAFCLALAGGIIYIVWMLILGKWFLRESQLFLIGSYGIFCYGVSKLGVRYFGTRRGNIIYWFFGICSMCFSNYSCLYNEFIAGRPLTAAYLAVVFMVVYAEVFWKDRDFSRKNRFWRISKISAVMTLVFAGQRFLEIVIGTGSIFTTETGYETTNWFLYRMEIWKILFGGLRAKGKLDIIGELEIPDFHMTWLGYAFGKEYLCLYLVVVILLLYCLIAWIRRCKNRSAFYMVSLYSVLISNIFGIIAELNLFCGADIGVLISQNVYQIVPVIFLIILNASEAIDRRDTNLQVTDERI